MCGRHSAYDNPRFFLRSPTTVHCCRSLCQTSARRRSLRPSMEDRSVRTAVCSFWLPPIGVHPAPLRFDTVREPVSGVIPAWISSSLRHDPVYGVLSWRAMWNARHVSNWSGILHAIDRVLIRGVKVACNTPNSALERTRCPLRTLPDGRG